MNKHDKHAYTSRWMLLLCVVVKLKHFISTITTFKHSIVLHVTVLPM